MTSRQSATFQDALDMVESLSEDQQEALVDLVRRRLVERQREILAEHIKEARAEFARGEARRGTVDDLMREIAE